MWSTQQRATRPAELVFKPKVYGRFEEGVTVLSEATVTLGGVYVALMPVQIWIWCCFCVVITRIITLLTGHTPKGDNRLSSMLNRPYYPFL